LSDLLATAIAAHGGLERWDRFRSVELDLSIGGVLWDLKGQPGLFATTKFEADLKKQVVTLSGFGSPGLRIQFTPDRLTIERTDGAILKVRDNPRGAFDGHRFETPWDLPHAAYFNAYALWTYAMQPFLYAYPGFVCEELAPWLEGDETWRRLKVTFPENVASHSRDQITYFGPDGLMRRHDYSVDVLGGATGAQLIDDYRDIRGLKVPHRRRVYPLGDDGHPAPEPLLVSIAVQSVRFAPG
jgi:hypothetical protein